MTDVSAVVISHGHAEELGALLPVLAPQVDELVVVANRPGSLPAELPPGTRVPLVRTRGVVRTCGGIEAPTRPAMTTGRLSCLAIWRR